MGLPAVKDDRVYRYREWPHGERWELIDGVAYDMSLAPSTAHQAISTELVAAIHPCATSGGCRVFVAPFDVVANVVQPDLAVVCDPSKLKTFGCVGALDWIVEILSPYTSRRDLVEKHALYERHRVKEYWVIDPGNRFVHVYLLGDDRTFGEPQIFVGTASVTSRVCFGVSVMLEDLFAAIPG
jgi:Uma2 family endonuclease